MAECGVHFSPQTLTPGDQKVILGGVIHQKFKKAEAALHLQGKLSDHDQRLGSIQKQLDLQGFLNSNSPASNEAATGDAGGSAGGYQHHTDVKYLKDMFLDERNKRE